MTMIISNTYYRSTVCLTTDPNNDFLHPIQRTSSVVSRFESSLNLETNQSNMRSGVEKTIRQELGAMITKVCHKYRDDISLDTIEYFFNKEFLYELNVKKEGFDSFQELIECLIQNNYPIEWYFNGEGIRCLRTNRQYFYWLSVIKCDRNYHLMDILSDIPEDVITCGQQLPEFKFPKEVPLNGCPEILSGDILKESVYSEVKLMSARSPHEMYLNLCGEEYHNSYHKLMIEMRLYDNKEVEDRYRIPSLVLSEDLLCVIKYPKVCDEWHRCRVLSVDKQNNCRLFLVDIGDVIQTNANNLRLLLKKFAKLSAQALKVQLMGIRPLPAAKSTHNWSDWAKNMVIAFEDDKYCGKMECAFIDYQSDRYRVYIRCYQRYKSSDINDLLFMHQMLIDKKLALTSSNDKPID